MSMGGQGLTLGDLDEALSGAERAPKPLQRQPRPWSRQVTGAASTKADRGRVQRRWRGRLDQRPAISEPVSRCWLCEAPALAGRTVCTAHAAQLAPRAGELRAGSTTKTNGKDQNT
jgi:hypothetical protein